LADLGVNSGAGRVGCCDVFAVDFIHGGKVCEVGNENLHFDHICPGCTRFFQQHGDIIENLASLFFDGGGRFTSLRVVWALCRHEEHGTLSEDGGGVGASGFCTFGGNDWFTHGWLLL
jgi:hypothetical protein